MRYRSRSVAVAVAVAVVVLGALVAVTSREYGQQVRPISAVVAGAPSAVVSDVHGVRHVRTHIAPARLLFDSIPPTDSSRLLWLNGRRAAPSTRGALVIDDAGAIIEYDRVLHPHMRNASLSGREPISVAEGDSGSLWLTDASGHVLHVRPSGQVQDRGTAPFSFPEVASSARGGALWLSRSRYRFSYALPTETAPLLARRARHDGEGGGDTLTSLGRAVRPAHVPLTELANAGQLAIGLDRVFYAPFIRDDVVAFSLAGDTLWESSRALPHSTVAPRFEVDHGHVVVDYHPVNLGIVMGPDDRVYVLSTTDSSMSSSRLDVFDAMDGSLLRSVVLPSPTPTIAVTAEGRVHVFGADKLRPVHDVKPREPVPPLAYATLAGGRFSTADHHGKVVLLNLWASWCAPCREEMPALDSLQRAMPSTDFHFVALNDDRDQALAARFIQQRGFTFDVALGGGDAKATLHAPGLPVTLLIDREGREVQRWTGFSGHEQIEAIRAAVQAELRRGSGSTMTPMAGGHHHGM